MKKQFVILASLLLLGVIAGVSAESIGTAFDRQLSAGERRDGGVRGPAVTELCLNAQSAAVMDLMLASDTADPAQLLVASSPKVGSTCTSGNSYCENRGCGAREKTCNCVTTGGVTTCTWSDWAGCGMGSSCSSMGYGGSC